MTTVTPESQGLELYKIKRSMHHDVISSFWTMLQELRGKANDDDDALLKVQVEGWYRQWNRMTGDNKEPNWTVREPLNVREVLDPFHSDKYMGSREPAAIEAKIREIVAGHMGISTDDTLQATTLSSIGADSLDEIELLMALEDEFMIEISDDEGESMRAGGIETAVSVVLRILNR